MWVDNIKVVPKANRVGGSEADSPATAEFLYNGNVHWDSFVIMAAYSHRCFQVAILTVISSFLNRCKSLRVSQCQNTDGSRDFRGVEISNIWRVLTQRYTC